MSDLIQHIRDRDLDGLRRAIGDDPAGARQARVVVSAGGLAWQAGLELLLEAGADLNAMWRNYRPIHALLQEDPHAAAGTPTPEGLACLTWMLAHGADPEQTGAWPLARAIVVAAHVGAPAFVELLIQGCAQVDGFAAAALGRRKAVEKAIRSDPGFPMARDHGGLTALQCAAGSRMPDAEKLAIARMLLDAGADVRAQTKSWSNVVDAVYFAAGTKDLQVFQLLLERGAEPAPALSSALWAGAYELAEAALAHGAVADRAVASKRPLLNDLIRWGQFEAALWLLERKASPNVPDERGWTAVHQAASRGNERMLRAVLAAGGDRNLRNLAGNLPRELTKSAKVAAVFS